MSGLELAALIAFGAAGGVAGGVLGVGGGVLFVPALVLFAGHDQLEAESTSLVAVALVGLVGAWRQHGYDNLRVRDGVAIGVLSPLGAVLGVVLANAVPQRALELGFAAMALYFVTVFARRALTPRPDPRAGGADTAKPDRDPPESE